MTSYLTGLKRTMKGQGSRIVLSLNFYFEAAGVSTVT